MLIAYRLRCQFSDPNSGQLEALYRRQGYFFCLKECSMFWLDSSNTGVTFEKGINPHAQGQVHSHHTFTSHRHKSGLLQTGSFGSPLMLESRFDLWPQERPAAASLMFCGHTNVLQTVWPLEAAGKLQSEPSKDAFKGSATLNAASGPFGSSRSALVWALWCF